MAVGGTKNGSESSPKNESAKNDATLPAASVVWRVRRVTSSLDTINATSTFSNHISVIQAFPFNKMRKY